MLRKAESLSDFANVFHPKAFTGEQMEFYQPTGLVRYGEAYEYHDSLYERIQKSDQDMHFLVIGHGGCGKSTELNVLYQKLEDEGTPAVLIRATDDLSLNDFTYIDIFVLIVQHITKYAHDKGLAIADELLYAFQAALKTTITEEYWEKEADAAAGTEIGISVKKFLTFITKFSASLRVGSGIKESIRAEIKPRMPQIIEAMNHLIDEVKANFPGEGQEKNIVILLDGLEKCHPACVRKLFIEDGSSLRAIRSHMVIACPISLYRSPDAAILIRHFDDNEIMPMIKTHHPDGRPYAEGVDVIRKLILKRTEAACFEEGVLEKIIQMGGGNLRETFYLLINSAHTAHMRRKEKIDLSCVEFTCKKYAPDLFLRADTKLYPIMQKIYDGDHQLRSNEESAALLYAEVVYEYNGNRWIDLHPLIRQHIAENPGVLDV